MKFTPLTEEQINSINLLPEGIYDFTVVTAKDEDEHGNKIVSKSGNEQMILNNKVYDNEGKERLIFDYFPNTLNMGWKFRQLCDSLGILDSYNTGEVHASNLLGKSGKVHIVIQHDATGKYASKNVVKAYLKKDNLIESKSKPSVPFIDQTSDQNSPVLPVDIEDDNIPF